MTILTAPQIWRRAPAEVTAGRQLANRLSITERDDVRAAVLYLCGRYRTLGAQVAALGMSRDAIAKARSRSRAQTYRLACMVARAAGVDVGKILSGAWPGDRCPHCGGTGKRSQIVSSTK